MIIVCLILRDARNLLRRLTSHKTEFMELHSAGHTRGVVCAPHHGAAEAGRAILAEGGNALEAMVAMAAAIAVLYPHMNHLGGDGFWVIRHRTGRVRAIMAVRSGGSQGHCRALSRSRDDPHTGTARGAHRAGCRRRLDDGGQSREIQRRPVTAQCLVGSGHRSRPQRLYRNAQPSAAHTRVPERARDGARFCQDVPSRGQAALNRHDAKAGGTRRHACPS